MDSPLNSRLHLSHADVNYNHEIKFLNRNFKSKSVHRIFLPLLLRLRAALITVSGVYPSSMRDLTAGSSVIIDSSNTADIDFIQSSNHVISTNE